MKRAACVILCLVFLIVCFSACTSAPPIQELVQQLVADNGYPNAQVITTSENAITMAGNSVVPISVCVTLDIEVTRNEYLALYDAVLHQVLCVKNKVYYQIHNLDLKDGVGNDWSDEIYAYHAEIRDSEKKTEVTTSTTSDYNSNRHSDDDAFYLAKLIVKDYLKAPSSAVFCPQSEAVVSYLGNGEYMVTGWVESQNSLGVMIRSDFIVTYTATKTGYKNAYAIIE